MIMKSIRISDTTYSRLRKLGDLGDTFDSVIERLLDTGSNTGTKGGKK